MLRRLGHHVVVAFDGPTGIDVVASFAPDMVFLDIGLPGMNGYDVVRALRKTEQARTIPIYAITGYANETHKNEAIRAGFTAHVPKPRGIETLKAILSLPRIAASDGK